MSAERTVDSTLPLVEATSHGSKNPPALDGSPGAGWSQSLVGFLSVNVKLGRVTNSE